MATTASPMASQLKSSFTSSVARRLVIPRGISGAPFRVSPSKRTPCFTVKAIQAEKVCLFLPTFNFMEALDATNTISCVGLIWELIDLFHCLQPTYQVIQPINGDPFIGSLETPITSSPLIAWFLSNLPAYRTAVSPLLRGIEVGLAHGFLLVGPFVKTGPLRNTEYAGAAGSLAAAGLVVILSICATMYGIASFSEGEPSSAPGLTLTGRKKVPDQLQTADGWAQFSGGFFFGGISGVTWAYFLLYVINLPYFFK